MNETKETSSLVIAVIPTWNRKADLLETLKSLEESDYQNLRVIVVDNGSTDGSVEAVRSVYPDVEVIQLENNTGAAFASNRGIEAALKQGPDYILRMDSDIVIEPSAVGVMVGYANTHAEVGMIYPKILRFDAPHLIWFKGTYSHPLFMIRGGKRFNQPDDGASLPVKIDYVASATILIRREAIEKVGLFDERFFVYGEDADLFLRFRNAGYPIVYLPEASAQHKIGSEKPSEFASFQQFRGLTIFYMKHSQGLHRTFLKFYVYVYAIMRSTFRKPLVNFQSALSGIRDGFKAMRQ